MSTPTPAKTTISPLLVSTERAAHLLGIGLTKFWGMHKSGELGPAAVKIGTRSLWNVKELQAWIDNGMPRRDRWQKIWQQQQKAKVPA